MGLTTILYQREKYEYETKQIKNYNVEPITAIINSLTFFIAHFRKENEK
jgi:hypothetical protein